jgi:membrane protease YdiL (CAAX protease family)
MLSLRAAKLLKIPTNSEVSMSTTNKQNFLVRRPLLAYFILSYAFFWLILGLFGAVVVGVLHLDPNNQPGLLSFIRIAGSWMPSLAAAIVVGAGEGREAVARLFAKFIQFRVPARWYLASLIPAGLAALAVLVYRVTGGLPQGGVPLTAGFWVSLVLIGILTGATGEEPGWRGFALPRLLERFSPLGAGLLLGVLWSFWHLPLWFTTGYSGTTLLSYILAFNVGVISLGLVMVWIYLRTPHSLVPMFLAHFTFNFGIELVGPAGLGLGASLPLMGWLAGLLLLTAVIIWALRGLNPQNSV